MKNLYLSIILVLAASSALLLGQPAAITPAQQAKIDAQLALIQTWAKDPVIVNAVKAQNANLPADFAAMTEQKWQKLSVIDPFVRALTRNDAAQLLKVRKSDLIGELFLSDENGLKVAFLSKTTFWCHKGKPKHDMPMAGKTWQGPIQIDDSTGWQLVQISAPVLEGDQPIGSLIAGIVISKLGKN